MTMKITPIPNTFIIGAPKCGTTSLAHYLETHPSVFFSKPKEPLYWCSEFSKLAHEPEFENLDDYLRLFSNANPDLHNVIAEGSTRYLISECAVPDILKFNPNSKFIVMLRKPVEMVPAYHGEQVLSLYESCESFEQAWSNEAKDPNLKQAFKRYRDIARFGTQLRRIKKVVADEQLLIILMDDFIATPAKVYLEVLSFLGLPDDGRRSFPRLNPAKRHRFNSLAKLVLLPPKSIAKPISALREIVRGSNLSFIAFLKSILKVEQPRPKLSELIRKEILEHYESEVREVELILGRDLSAWRT